MPPPYPSRAEIDNGALQNKADVLVWVDDPIAAFFLQVQGSGRVRLDNGATVSLAYAGNNGMPYTAIGRVLVVQGWLQPADVNAASIIAWLKAHPDKAQAVLESDARYVFFRRSDQPGPVGAAGRPLVAGISMAVDPDSIPLGSLVWLALDPGSGQKTPRLMVADDKGVAIKGAVRGDIYLGSGEAAGAEAGQLKATGRYWLFVPLP
jgi:membrane-bound lytic murein transglycosylase A